MRAFAVPEFNGAGSVVERPVPTPDEGQVLVRVRAAGVNPMDPFVVSGVMSGMLEHRLPIVPGFDYAGTVEALGPGVSGLKVGDEVYGAVGKSFFGEGSWAEYVVVNAALANHRPKALGAIEAAALPTAGGTAIALWDALGAKRGDTILVVGAAGGVGSFVTQLAVRAGVTVIAATRAKGRDFVMSMGASEVVDSAGDIVAQVRKRHPDGVTGIIDTYNEVAGLKVLAPIVQPGGRIVSPKARGAEDAFADQPVEAVVVSAALGRVGELGDLAARGELKVPVTTLALDHAGRALKAIGSAGVRGKLVVMVADGSNPAR